CAVLHPSLLNRGRTSVTKAADWVREPFTVTCSFCFLPLALSSILASPSASGVTTPSLLTAATLEFDDLNWVCPVTSWSEPSASFPVTTMRSDAHLPARTKSPGAASGRSEEHTSELQSLTNL